MKLYSRHLQVVSMSIIYVYVLCADFQLLSYGREGKGGPGYGWLQDGSGMTQEVFDIFL